MRRPTLTEDSVEYELLHQLEKREPNRRVTVPDMEVTCDLCGTDQLIPATSSEFRCFHCSGRIPCQKLFSKFRCGCCRVTVLFDHKHIKDQQQPLIRCSKCSNLNRLKLADA